uniref:Uncharacterized protein n=1 Tax=Rhizophora mucronata TaxID=61149 RepID=A0A2P2JBU1_RHIMU
MIIKLIEFSGLMFLSNLEVSERLKFWSVRLKNEKIKNYGYMFHLFPCLLV